jgi:4-hydroxy-tetrahydrodipicolinate reductase
VSQCDVLVDFSLPDVFDALVEAAIRHRVPLVSGTTGLTPGQLARLDRLALVAPCVHSPNMSLGIQVLLDLAGRAARALGPAYDLAVVESHHRHKKDAPSGTAKRILEALAQASAPALAADAIPTFSVRGGDVVGDHTVHFLGPGDRIELTHRATSRETFANGALRAARWLVEQPAGRYELRQVLGL